ncbi:MAG TPA: 3-dehydroquinate synthase [Gemmatimonadaceae bacterium]|nr:3-dehydroquinate synthase [Gemmatimonadaceae bacterium]
MPIVSLPTYDITVRCGALDDVGTIVRSAAPAHRYAIVTDTVVAPLFAERVRSSFGPEAVDLLSIQAGEEHKTRETWQQLTDRLLASGIGRDSAIVALGGGVVGDVAGFVAATYMRGIPHVQVPTTLLAMIDASVGGKTGVDTPAGKNLVGAFHQPAAVVIDPEALATLPAAQIRSGLAEAIKHAVVADGSYFDRIDAQAEELLARFDATAFEPVILRSVEIKTQVVRQDERESGLRKVLNFGHTLGHAIESASGYSLLHGEAVACGMALEARLAEAVDIAEPDTASRIIELLHRVGLPTGRPASLDAELLLRLTYVDKKARGGAVEYALPRRIGAMADGGGSWSVPVADQVVMKVLA